MGIQATGSFTYNNASYDAPYFRITLYLAATGDNIPVETRMYRDYSTFVTSSIPALGSGDTHITSIGFNITGSAPTNASGSNVTDKYLYWVSSEIINQLESMSPSTTFTITNITVD